MTHWGDDFAGNAHGLRLLRPDGKVQLLALSNQRTLHIGSSPDSDLVLLGDAIAEQHCKVSDHAGRLRLVDRGSAYGTTINGDRCIEPTYLKENDRVGVGPYVLEVLHGRRHLAEGAIADELHNDPAQWRSSESTVEANFVQLLSQEAQAWEERGRPSRLLLRDARLKRALSLHDGSPQVRAWLDASLRRRHLLQALRWLGMGLLPGLLAATVIILSIPSEHEEPQFVAEPAATSTQEPRIDHKPVSHSKPTCVDYRPPPLDTITDVANDFGIPPETIARANALTIEDQPPEEIVVCGSRVEVLRERVELRIAAGESWTTRARALRLTEERLRRYNPTIARELEEDDVITAWVDPAVLPEAKPPLPVFPEDALSAKHTNDGDLENAIRLHSTDLFEIRCGINAHASSHTAKMLSEGLRKMRETYRYRGALIVADLSREAGGKYGPHRSHQSGRDVDVWLPVRGGVYRENCKPRCGTSWCKPRPDEIDWDATLTLIRALHDTGSVKQIFLNIPRKVRRQKRDEGHSEILALVTHEASHTRHLHVRFRCGPIDSSCQN